MFVRDSPTEINKIINLDFSITGLPYYKDNKYVSEDIKLIV